MRYFENPEQDVGGGGTMTGAPTAKPRRPKVPGQPGASDDPRLAQPQQPQTFSQMQKAGIARPPMPAPRPAAPAGVQMAPGGRMITRTADTILPSGAPAPTTPAPAGAPNFDPMEWLRLQILGGAQGETGRAFDYLGGRIDDDYDTRQQGLEEEMARRGLADSTVYGGRTQDLNVGRRSAKADLAERLGGNQSALQMQALAQMLGLGQQGFENDMAYNQWLMQMLGLGYGG